eukprot:COSAG02_NODE_5400_length_4362_cov_3.969505_6_plen_143_part_00
MVRIQSAGGVKKPPTVISILIRAKNQRLGTVRVVCCIYQWVFCTEKKKKKKEASKEKLEVGTLTPPPLLCYVENLPLGCGRAGDGRAGGEGAVCVCFVGGGGFWEGRGVEECVGARRGERCGGCRRRRRPVGVVHARRAALL